MSSSIPAAATSASHGVEAVIEALLKHSARAPHQAHGPWAHDLLGLVARAQGASWASVSLLMPEPQLIATWSQAPPWPAQRAIWARALALDEAQTRVWHLAADPTLTDPTPLASDTSGDPGWRLGQLHSALGPLGLLLPGASSPSSQDRLLMMAALQALAAGVCGARARQDELGYVERSLELIGELSASSGRLWRVNPAWASAFGVELGSLQGVWLPSLIWHEDRALIEQALRVAAQGSPVMQIEARMAQQPSRWIAWSLAPTKRPDVLMVMGREDTPLKQAQQRLELAQLELERERQEAQRAYASKRRFLANASHELRTPLHGLLGMTQLLIETPLDARQRDYVEALAQSARSLEVIIEDVLDLASQESGHSYAIHPTRFRLRDLLEELIVAHSQEARRKALELSWTLDPALPRFLEADAKRLRQILNNLVGNALKFTTRGQVTLRVALTDDAQRLRLEVEDSGPGIAPEHINRLGEPFYRADATTHGTGLGLAITRQLVHAMGGQLQLRSALGQGSTFSVELLLTASAPSPDEEQATGALFGVAPRALLLTSHDADARHVEALCQSWGVRLSRCSPHRQEVVAAQARALAERSPLDLILLDSRASHADDLLRWLRSDARFADLGVLWIEPLQERSALAQRLAHAVVTWPLRRDALLHALLSMPQELRRPSLHEDSELLVLPTTPIHQERAALLVSPREDERQALTRALARFGLGAELAQDQALASIALRRQSYPLLILACDEPLDVGFAQLLQESPLLSVVGVCDGLDGLPERVDLALLRPLTRASLDAQLGELLFERDLVKLERLTRQDGARPHLLVAEDQPISQRVITGMLERLGCTWRLVGDGLEAVEAARQERFDAVLMDCQMPRLDGLQATRQIRDEERREHRPHTPILALTAHDHPEDRQRILQAGMDHVLSKPLRLEQLMRALLSWMHHDLQGPTHATRSGAGRLGIASAPRSSSWTRADEREPVLTLTSTLTSTSALDPHALDLHALDPHALDPQATEDHAHEPLTSSLEGPVTAPMVDPDEPDEPGQEPWLELRTLKQLIQDCQDPTFVRELIQELREQSATHLRALQLMGQGPGLSGEEVLHLGQIAHALKGTCSIFGLARVAALCRQIDERCRHSALTREERGGLLVLARALQRALTRSLQRLEQAAASLLP